MKVAFLVLDLGVYCTFMRSWPWK